MIKIYVDGSAHPNPGPGGYGVFGFDDATGEVLIIKSHQFEHTTNNAMELTAILEAFKVFGQQNSYYKNNNVTIYTDSAYSYNTLTKWIFDWQKRGWKKADKKVPENLDLVKEYWSYYEMGWRVNFELIPGHSGIEYNELVDKLATGKITLEEIYNEYRDETYTLGRITTTD